MKAFWKKAEKEKTRKGEDLQKEDEKTTKAEDGNFQPVLSDSAGKKQRRMS